MQPTRNSWMMEWSNPNARISMNPAVSSKRVLKNSLCSNSTVFIDKSFKFSYI